MSRSQANKIAYNGLVTDWRRGNGLPMADDIVDDKFQ
jgi:hypothetical protein